jgi:molecular chaperone GrpE
LTTEKNAKKTKNAKKDSPAPKAIKTKISADPENNSTQQIETLTEQLAAEKDRVLRLSAEFENYKKRSQRELSDFKKFANETVFKAMLTVVDNLERAIGAAKENSQEGGLLEGVELTRKDILKLFETFNVKPVEAQNQPFDPKFHQAVTQEETDKVPENTVTTVLQKGYLLHDRLIRPAMVVVSKKVEKETEKTKEN